MRRFAGALRVSPNLNPRRIPGKFMADDELDLSTLSDEDLVSQMHDDLYDGLKEEIEEGVRILLSSADGRHTRC